MSYVVTFKAKSSILSGDFAGDCLWQYQVQLDPLDAGAGMIGLGFSSKIDIKDPRSASDIPQLGTMTLSKSGDATQFVLRDVSQAVDGVLDIYLVAPCPSDNFTPITLVTLALPVGVPAVLPFRLSTEGTTNSTQVIAGPAIEEATTDDAAAGKAEILPYASEPFGVYQPLIGWRSSITQERVARAVSRRVMTTARMIGDATKYSIEAPVAALTKSSAIDRTGTLIGQQLAQQISAMRGDGTRPIEWGSILKADPASPLSKIAHAVISGLQQQANTQQQPVTSRTASRLTPIVSSPAAHIDRETATASLLHYLGQNAPSVLELMFKPGLAKWERTLNAALWFESSFPAKDAFLSPIGILHLFQEYFFELGTFLGPPVGHVWLSPGGTVELVEVNTRHTLIEKTIEASTETMQKTELDETNQDELSDAVKQDNATDMKLGVSATASGGVPHVFQASGTSSFNVDISRKQAQEQTHKKMREQSSKLSSEVRQNYKTTFRTVTETTDTSSRRYVLQNTTSRLVSYELSRKMRKVAVQVQDLGQRLCWQLYIDNPGDPLGLGEFVHATSAALDPDVKLPEYQAYPTNTEKTYSLAIPFVLHQGADDDATDTYVAESGYPDHGIFVPDAGKNDIIQFKFDIKCPPAPPGFVLVSVGAIDFHGAQVQYESNLPVDAVTDTFSIRLTYANFGGKQALPFDVTLVYEPTAAAKTQVDQANAQLKTAYDDQVAQKKEQLFYDTLRTRLKLVGQVKPRPQDDLRDEERTVIYRNLIAQLYGNESGWSSEDYHVASELIRYFFDIDAMLYFVAEDWWHPRHQALASVNNQGELQPTIIAEPAVSERVGHIGKHRFFRPGHRPYYLITEETTPAPMGASLGWLIQLDGDVHRNAFLNSPWVKAVLPIRPGREREAIAWLQRPEVAGTDGLDQPYPYDAAQDPPDYAGLKIRDVLLKIADKIAQEYQASLVPVPIDPAGVNPQVALPTETVFSHGFDPLEGGIKFGSNAFEVFSQWIEILPTDQVVATEYKLTS
jgi:hypothetical protein